MDATLGAGFLDDVLAKLSTSLEALKPDFFCCSDDTSTGGQRDSYDRALHRGMSPYADLEESLPGLGHPSFGVEPTVDKFGNMEGFHIPGDLTPTSTSASSRNHGGGDFELPIGQHVGSEPLSSLSGSSGNGDRVELPEVVDERGARYRGQWLGDERHGYGVLITAEGLTYEGQFRHGQAHGRGSFMDIDGSVYEGQWVEDKKRGFGKHTHPDGTTYEGQWVDCLKSGTGSEQWADGAKFEGQFAHGCKNGAGIYKSGGGAEYIGQFQDDVMHGMGTYTFECGRKYAGHWQDGRMNGQGRMDWPNGAYYDGDYENGVKSGTGTFVNADGCSYSGEWKNGKQHGKGVSKDATGSRWYEVWEHGVCTISSADPGILTMELPTTAAGDPGCVEARTAEQESLQSIGDLEQVLQKEEPLQDHVAPPFFPRASP